MSEHARPHLVVDDAQADRAVHILVDSFLEDPTWSTVFPDPANRRIHYSWFWRIFLAGAMRYRFVWLNQDEVAVSVWIPPGCNDLAPDQEIDLERGLEERLGEGASRVMRAFELFERNHPRDEPHFYLSLLGTDPRHLGHGHGLRLLEANLTMIDELRFACYLEASNPANVALYARYGFRVRGGFEPFGGGPLVTTMWRDAAPDGDSDPQPTSLPIGRVTEPGR